MVYRNSKTHGHADTLRVERLRVRVHSSQECFIHIYCESRQTGFSPAPGRGPHLDFEALHVSKFGIHITRQEQSPIERVYFTNGQL